ncbi:hypothetical protein D3C73_1219540 [compost metagenome]
MSKPRAEYFCRPGPSDVERNRPGVFLTTSLMLVIPWSSMRWRVITVTAWGVSRMVSGSLVAVDMGPVV